MNTVRIKGYVHASKSYKRAGDYEFAIYSCKTSGDALGLFVGEVDIDYVVPADWNPVAAEVSVLEAQKAQALADYQATVAQINERLSKLLALTNEVA